MPSGKSLRPMPLDDAKVSSMSVDGLFASATPHIANFARQQALLYRENPRLQIYFEALQVDRLSTPRARARKQASWKSPAHAALARSSRVARLSSMPKVKADVLICPSPYFSRKTETQFFLRTVFGVAATGAKIACFVPKSAPGRRDMVDHLTSKGLLGQVELIDPVGDLGTLSRPLLRNAARQRGQIAFDTAVEILAPHGLAPGEDVLDHFERLAYFAEAWSQIEDRIEFSTAITRCHWLPLCSSVTATALQRGSRSITFQQGVIGHSLDVPVLASTFVAFGETSSSFLSRLNARFFEAVGLPAPSVSYVHGGSLFDRISNLEDQFAKATLLMVDYPTSQTEFYGVQKQTEALIHLGEAFLAEGNPSWRLIIRPHPFWNDLDLESCLSLARRFPQRCEISHPARPLDDDLCRSSAAVGIFSGVLTVASASGLPSYFLKTQGGFESGDLACFERDQILAPDEALEQIKKIFQDHDAYLETRTAALRNGRTYYAGGANLALDETFFRAIIEHPSS
jgi:hypothetical protein